MGNKLYGGIGFDQEANALNNLGMQFTEADINRQQQNYQYQTQLASQIMQLLQGQPISTSPIGYSNPVASADTQYGGAVSQRGQDLTYQAQQDANQSALYSALFGGLGTMAGGALGGPLGASLGASLGGIAGGNVAGTGLFGTKLGGKTQSEILGYPTAAYQ